MRRKISIIAAAIAICVLFTGCGDNEGSEEVEVPVEYTVGEETIEAMTASDGSSLSEAVIDEETGISRYVYTGFPFPGAKAALYSRHMAEANEFSVVGEDYRPAKEPDFTAESGKVMLSRPTGETNIILLELEWGDKSCIITTSLQPAPPPEEKNTVNLGVDIEDYIKGLDPSFLELEGSSMEEYNTYIANGRVMIEDYECTCIKVYSEDDYMHTNDPAGTYFITGDRSHIYRLDKDGESVYELHIS